MAQGERELSGYLISSVLSLICDAVCVYSMSFAVQRSSAPASSSMSVSVFTTNHVRTSELGTLPAEVTFLSLSRSVRRVRQAD